MQRTQFLTEYKLLTIFIISLIICLFNINGFPIYILDEAKNAEAAREMLYNSNFIVPTFNDQLRTDKPPLHYFFMILSYKIFGVSAFSARFFSSVFGALTLAGTYYFINLLSDYKRAVLSWFVLISAVFFVQLFHQAVPDPYLVFFVSMGLFCFLAYYNRRKEIFLYLFYVFLGFGILSKGPVAIVLPFIIVAIYLHLKKELFSRKIFRYSPFLGLLIILAISAPWYVAVHYATDGIWTHGFFYEHNFNRFNNKMEGHGGIFLITWGFVILGLLPFSVFILQSIREALRDRQRSLVLFSIITAAIFILFFSISSTKLPNYTMPCYPFIALLIGDYFYKLINKNLTSKWYKLSLISLIIISVALPVGVYFVFIAENQLESLKWLSLWLIIAPFGSILSYILYQKKMVLKSIFAVGITWILLGLVIFSAVYPKLLNQNPVSQSFRIIPENAQIIAYKRLDAAFPFNYKSTFKVVNTADSIEVFLEKNPNTYIISNHKNVINELEGLNLDLKFQMKALFENHKTYIFRKQ